MLFSEEFSVSGEVKIFPMENPWVYVVAPQKYKKMFEGFTDRGLVAITARVGQSSWKTSLMPTGDGTQFIPLPKKIRTAEKIEVGDQVTVLFRLRER